MTCYDPLKLADIVENQVYIDKKGSHLRKYWRIRASRHYGGNVAGDVVGCNLRCAFCWAWRYAFNTNPGFFLSPIEASRRIMKAGPFKIARLTGGEPTIGWEHTRRLASILTMKGYLFILETNGILIGSDRVEVSSIPKGVFIRVSIKAPNSEVFEKVTGACKEFFHLQLKALEKLYEHGLAPGKDFRASIVMGLSTPREYSNLINKLSLIDERLIESLEPEFIILYPHVAELLRRRRFKPYLAYKPDGTPVYFRGF